MFNLDPNALAALMASAGEAHATETPARGNPRNLQGVFEFLNALGGGQIRGNFGAAVAGAGDAANPAVTPQVEDVGQVEQASQNQQDLATPAQATNGMTSPGAPTRAQEEFKGVQAAIEKVIERCTVARVKKELKWQWSGGAANYSKFKEEALTPGQGIKVYGFVQEDSPVIQVIHGLGRFFDSEAPEEISGKPIAFIGDRSRFGEPRPVIPPPKATWEWKAATVSKDETVWAVNQAEEQNEGKLWAHGGLAAEITLPRLVYLPAVIAKFVSEKPRTAWEVHQHLNEMTVSEESLFEEGDIENLKKWLLAVGQVAGAKALALSMAPVVTTVAVFEEWCFHHINSYLGEKVVDKSDGPATPAPQAAGGLEEVVRLLLQSFAEQNNKQSTNGAADKSENEKVTPYTQYQVAMLAGYCNEFDTAQLPEFWKLVKTTKETEDHRMNLY
jgi:hypothetical protein